MIVKLVSFPDCDDSLSLAERKLRIRSAAEILNAKDSDFVMFSEWILTSKNDLKKLAESVHNKKVTALFELKLAPGLEGNRLFLLQNGEIKDLKTHQIFMKSKDVDDNNIEKLINELEQSRQFKCNGKRFLIVQCGENNILKTIKIKGIKNRAEFRLNNRDLKNRFDKILSSVDIVLNPTHGYWSRFYDLTCRLYKFSESRRYCFYCTQLSDNMLANAHLHPEKNSTQRCYHSRRLIAPIYCSDKEEQNYLMQSYEIK